MNDLLKRFIFHESIILRAPLFPYKVYSTWDKSTILNDIQFQLAIWNASQSLYESLKRKNFEYASLSKKEKDSIAKYYNRICFRPTPFGLFSSISHSKWIDTRSNLQFQNIKLHTAPAFKDLREKLSKAALLSSNIKWCQFNYSSYKVGNELRYFVCITENDRNTFRINSISRNDLIDKIAFYFKTPKSYKETFRFLSTLGYDDVSELLEQLIEEQILLTNLVPNITYKNFLSKSACKGEAYTRKFISLNDLQAQVAQGAISNTINIITERPLGENNGLNNKYQNAILTALKANLLLSPDYESQSLEEFRNKFEKRFERQCIPLLKALDPETGVGYSNLEKQSVNELLYDDLDLDLDYGTDARVYSINLSPHQIFILNRWFEAKNNNAISFKIEDLEKIKSNNDTTNFLSPSLSVFFRLCNEEKIFIENVGGPSACSVNGRFTPFNEELDKLNVEIATLEQKNNPEVIFAEIIHIDDNKAANVELRNMAREYEIPILAKSSTHTSKQILLSDLWVQVVKDEVVLWSKRLQKRIIPRLSSSYNHGRSSLALFRFLCDLQYQKISIPTSFNLSSILPELNHYPRVEVENIILQLEEWKLSIDDLKKCLNTSSIEKENLEALKTHLDNLKIPDTFAISQSDKQLVLQKNNDGDLLLFLTLVRSEKKITLKEYPFLNHEAICLTDSLESEYLSQFISVLFNAEPAYKAPEIVPIFRINETKRKLIPGEHCFYIKIYCHTCYSNELLTRILLPFLKEKENAEVCTKWFFIRYQDPEHHIRLRIFCPEISIRKIFLELKQILKPLVIEGRVPDICLATYSRELERYGADRIEKIESLFHISSTIAASILNSPYSTSDSSSQLSTILSSIDQMTSAAGLSIAEKVNLHEIAFDAIRKQLNYSPTIYKTLQKRFREAKNSIFNGNHFLQDHEFELHEILSGILSGTFEVDKILLIDLVHMHINRLLTTDFLHGEMTIHYFLWRYYISIIKQQPIINLNSYSEMALFDPKEKLLN